MYEQVASDINVNRVKVSDLSSWHWCNEECFLRCHGINRRTTMLDLEGIKTHEEVVRPAEFEWEKEFFGKLEKLRPFFREVNSIRIYASVDAIDSSELKDKVVRIVEHKTRGKFDVPDYLIPSAEFQLQIYCWVFKPLVEKIDYLFADEHYLDFIHRDSLKLIKRVKYKVDYGKVRKDIRDILNNIRENKICKADGWKCRICHNDFKMRCRFFNDNLNKYFLRYKKDKMPLPGFEPGF